MIIQCAWCKKVIGEKAPLNDPMVSHTICRDCSIKHFDIDPEERKQMKKNPMPDNEKQAIQYAARLILLGRDQNTIMNILRKEYNLTLIQARDITDNAVEQLMKKNPGVKYHKEKLTVARDRANKSESLREADFWQGNIHAQSNSITDSKKLGTNPKPAFTFSNVRDMWDELSNNDKYSILQTAGIKVIVAKQAANQNFDSMPKWIQIKVVDFVNQLESESKKQNPAKKLTRFQIAERLYDLLNENSPNKVIGIAITKYKMSLDDATKLVNEIVAVTEGKYTKLKENFKVTKKPDHVVKAFRKDVEDKWNSLTYYDRARWVLYTAVITEHTDTALRIAAMSWKNLGYDIQRILIESYNDYWKKKNPYKKNPVTEEEVGDFIKKYAYASGGDWSAMLMSAIREAAKTDSRFAQLWKEMPDKSYTFSELLDLIVKTLEKQKSNPGAKWHGIEAAEAKKIANELKDREDHGAHGVHDSRVFYEGVFATQKRSVRHSKNMGINPQIKKVTILKNSSTGEYRVPGPAGTEAQAYYTDDKQDAIGTAEHMWKGVAGQDFILKIRSIPDFDRFLNDNPRLSKVLGIYRAADGFYYLWDPKAGKYGPYSKRTASDIWYKITKMEPTIVDVTEVHQTKGPIL